MKTTSMDKKPDMSMMSKHGECDLTKICPDPMAPSIIEDDPINRIDPKSIEVMVDEGMGWK